MLPRSSIIKMIFEIALGSYVERTRLTWGRARGRVVAAGELGHFRNREKQVVGQPASCLGSRIAKLIVCGGLFVCLFVSYRTDVRATGLS